MYKRFFCVLLVFTLTSCSIFQVRKPEIEQGNIITPQLIQQLHPGMTEDEVRNIMGTPALDNVFTAHRIDYVYTFQTGHQPRIQKTVNCIFVNGRLQSIYTH